MKKFWTIFSFEFQRQIKNKAFIIITAIFVVGSLVGGFFISRSLNEMFEEGMNPDQIVENLDVEKLYVYTPEQFKAYISQLEALEVYDVEYVSEDDLQQKVIDDDVIGLKVIDYGNITKVVSGTSIMSNFSQIDTILNTLYQNKLLTDAGLSNEQVMAYQQQAITIETLNVGVDGLMGYGYVYAYTMILFMTISIFGGIVSSSVITEKTSKAMEVLITSSKASSLVAGKVFAIGLSCILQLVLVITGLLTSVLLITDKLALEMIFASLGGIPLDVIALALVLFIFGFFSILFLFAGFSSFATKPEDANIVIAPLMLIIIFVYMINLSTMGTDILDTVLFKGLSYVPILSPFLMFSRYVLYGLSSLEIILGLITNILGAGLLILFAAKIYRAGTLHYGNGIKFSKIFKSIRN